MPDNQFPRAKVSKGTPSVKLTIMGTYPSVETGVDLPNRFDIPSDDGCLRAFKEFIQTEGLSVREAHSYGEVKSFTVPMEDLPKVEAWFAEKGVGITDIE